MERIVGKRTRGELVAFGHWDRVGTQQRCRISHGVAQRAERIGALRVDVGLQKSAFNSVSTVGARSTAISRAAVASGSGTPPA